MASAQPMKDHAEIRRWAEARGAQPACVKGTGGKGDVGMIRLDFPGFSGARSLQKISWDEWFRRFDESNLALLVQDSTARGKKSNFNKLVARESIGNGNRAGSGASTRRGARAAVAARRKPSPRNSSASKRTRSAASRGSASTRSGSSRRSATSNASSRSGGRTRKATARNRSGGAAKGRATNKKK